MTRRMEFVFGDIAMTLSEDDIEAVYTEWERNNPGKSIKHMKPKEFSDAMMERLKASARPTRTVIHIDPDRGRRRCVKVTSSADNGPINTGPGGTCTTTARRRTTMTTTISGTNNYGGGCAPTCMRTLNYDGR